MKLVLAARETTTLGGGQKIISEIDENLRRGPKVEFRATFSKRKNV